jgi:hypothetical protein
MVVLAMVYAPKVLPILSHEHLSPIQRHFAGTARKLNKPSLVFVAMGEEGEYKAKRSPSSALASFVRMGKEVEDTSRSH